MPTGTSSNAGAAPTDVRSYGSANVGNITVIGDVDLELDALGPQRRHIPAAALAAESEGLPLYVVEALRAAEILVRSGGFALLVLDLGERTLLIEGGATTTNIMIVEGGVLYGFVFALSSTAIVLKALRKEIAALRQEIASPPFLQVVSTWIAELRDEATLRRAKRRGLALQRPDAEADPA